MLCVCNEFICPLHDHLSLGGIDTSRSVDQTHPRIVSQARLLIVRKEQLSSLRRLNFKHVGISSQHCPRFSNPNNVPIDPLPNVLQQSICRGQCDLAAAEAISSVHGSFCNSSGSGLPWQCLPTSASPPTCTSTASSRVVQPTGLPSQLEEHPRRPQQDSRLLDAHPRRTERQDQGDLSQWLEGQVAIHFRMTRSAQALTLRARRSSDVCIQ